MGQIKAGAIEGGKSGAMVTGYGALGLLAESITSHRWPWLMPGAVTMATVTVLHAAVSAWQGWVEARQPALVAGPQKPIPAPESQP